MTISWWLLFPISLILSFATSRLVLFLLHRKQWLDIPVARSSHQIPVPRGGGIAVAFSIILCWGYIAWLSYDWICFAVVLATISWMAIIGFWDDRCNLPPLPRLIAQCAAALALVLLIKPSLHIISDMLPLWLDRGLVVLGLIWFINATNFMDGIDGITGSYVATIALLWSALVLLFDINLLHPAYGLALAGSAMGFLYWNWSPARMFLGDVGSLSMGTALALLLLWLASHGGLVAAIILAAYYLADTIETMLRRLLRGEKIWQAHREHWYQQALQRGQGATKICQQIFVTNLGLGICAALSIWLTNEFAAPALGWLALLPASGLILYLRHRLTAP